MTMQDDQAASEPEAVQDEDPILAIFIRMAARGVQSDITLMVGGLLVSGVLVGFREYLEGLSNDFRNATSNTPGAGAAIAEGFDTVIAEADAEEPDDGSSDQQGPYGFIHLKDAHVRGPGGEVFEVPWWRGRLGAIDGFIFGRAV